MTLSSTSTLGVLLQKNTPPILFLVLTAFFTFLALNAAKFLISLGCVKHQYQAWWSLEVEKAVTKRLEAFSATHRSNENR